MGKKRSPFRPFRRFCYFCSSSCRGLISLGCRKFHQHFLQPTYFRHIIRACDSFWLGCTNYYNFTPPLSPSSSGGYYDITDRSELKYFLLWFQRRGGPYSISTFILIFWSPGSIYLDSSRFWNCLSYYYPRKGQASIIWCPGDTLCNANNWSFRFYLSFYLRRTHWNCPFQFFIGYCAPRYLLRCRPPCWVCQLIPDDNRINNESNSTEITIFSHICGSKHDFFPYTFFRASRHTTSVLRLPRLLCWLKFYCQSRVNNFYYVCIIIHYYLVRNIC